MLLIGPFSYVGDEIEMEVGLFAVEERDLALPLLNVVSAMSKISGLSLDDSVLKTGLDAVTKGKEGLDLGLFTSTRLRAGTILVTGFDLRNIVLAAFDVDSASHSEALRKQPYMLLNVLVEPGRDDYFKIDSIREVYQRVQGFYRRNDLKGAELARQELELECRYNPQLLPTDGERIVRGLLARIDGKLSAKRVKTAAGEGTVLPDIDELFAPVEL